MNTARKLITEVSTNITIDRTQKDFYAIGVFSSAELKNENGRIYKKNLLEREVSKIFNKVTNKSQWGELGHPSSPDINPDNVAILIEELAWDNNNVVGRAKVLDTPKGQITKTLMESGSVGISSRGLGTVSDSDSYVNDDFNLITYDIVLNPSNSPSWIKGIYEGKTFESPDVNTVDNAKKLYHKHIWQVLTNIEKSL